MTDHTDNMLLLLRKDKNLLCDFTTHSMFYELFCVNNSQNILLLIILFVPQKTIDATIKIISTLSVISSQLQSFLTVLLRVPHYL